MEIYLKHRERNELICLKKLGKGIKELKVYNNKEISYSEEEDKHIDEAHSWYATNTSQVNINGIWESQNNWLKSDENEFLTALDKAKQTINNF